MEKVEVLICKQVFLIFCFHNQHSHFKYGKKVIGIFETKTMQNLIFFI